MFCFLAEIEDHVKKILKLAKGINSGNKERRMKKKTEVLALAEDFQRHYDSLYSLYQDLREEVKKKMVSSGLGNEEDDDCNSSSSSVDSDVEAFSSCSTGVLDSYCLHRSMTSDAEETLLKDKLTASSEVKKTVCLDQETDFDKPEETVINEVEIQGKESQDAIRRGLEHMKYLERQVMNLQHELSSVSMQKGKLGDKLKSKKDQTLKLKSRVSRLEHQLLEFKAASEENELQLYSVMQQSEDNEQHYLSRTSDLLAQADDLQLEIDDLRQQKCELEARLTHETKQSTCQVSSLMEQLNMVNNRKAELELELRKASEDRSEYLIQIQSLTKELKDAVKENECLKWEIKSVTNKMSDLEEHIKKLNRETLQSNITTDELKERIYELQALVSKREIELSTEKQKTNRMSDEIKDLKRRLEDRQSEMEAYQKEKQNLKTELERERQESSMMISDLERKNAELKDENKQVVSQSRSNIQILGRKLEELAFEIRQQFEDRCRILNRRITIAEQLQADHKEWYSKTREADNNKINADNLAGLENMKAMAITANDILASLDSVSLKFDECSANFLGRISKVSSDLQFLKQTAARQNGALCQARGEAESLLLRVHDKEREILATVQRLRRSENRAREAEKAMKAKDERVVAVKEEEREAIRQLSVWIDYHRGRSDYYKKVLCDVMDPAAGMKKTS